MNSSAFIPIDKPFTLKFGIPGGTVEFDDPLAVCFAVRDATLGQADRPNEAQWIDAIRSAMACAKIEPANGSGRAPTLNVTEAYMVYRALLSWERELGKDSDPSPTSTPRPA